LLQGKVRHFGNETRGYFHGFNYAEFWQEKLILETSKRIVSFYFKFRSRYGKEDAEWILKRFYNTSKEGLKTSLKNKNFVDIETIKSIKNDLAVLEELMASEFSEAPDTYPSNKLIRQFLLSLLPPLLILIIP
jgi:hypothetical protein